MHVYSYKNKEKKKGERDSMFPNAKNVRTRRLAKKELLPIYNVRVHKEDKLLLSLIGKKPLDPFQDTVLFRICPASESNDQCTSEVSELRGEK
jgi:hypothetical protein